MFGFIVAGCIREEVHKHSLIECLQSIRKYHPNNTIVVIIDFTSDKNLVEEIILKFPDVIFEVETENYPADMQLLKFFKSKHYFDKAIMIQDSMRVTYEFKVDNIDKIEYLWHFNNHRTQWSVIEEPLSEYNIYHSIRTHDDLINHFINKFLASSFADYSKTYYMQKELWSGCFGCCCIMSYDFLLELEEKTNIIQIQSLMVTNRLRRAIESIFSLACEYTIGHHITDSYDDLYYDGIFHNNMTSKHIKKVSFDRQ